MAIALALPRKRPILGATVPILLAVAEQSLWGRLVLVRFTDHLPHSLLKCRVLVNGSQNFLIPLWRHFCFDSANQLSLRLAIDCFQTRAHSIKFLQIFLRNIGGLAFLLRLENLLVLPYGQSFFLDGTGDVLARFNNNVAHTGDRACEAFEICRGNFGVLFLRLGQKFEGLGGNGGDPGSSESDRACSDESGFGDRSGKQPG